MERVIRLAHYQFSPGVADFSSIIGNK